MSYKVNLDFVNSKVTINGKTVPMEEFSPNNELECSIQKVIDEFFIPVSAKQIEIEFDDVSELVRSDLFKGDNHSVGLIN